ncbi:tyrosine phosphatase family protein [Pseudovibrio exalbescens]|uniref:Tyrosine-protein phosphatase domain-containing protein n=1 Tax=Pseudovibrio exalbescens TaxID=197461 RepID=A0A1U7JCX4_9HYPH|nr:protein-tyrosine phosphatase family protein [Pseudovibrio exalbescens]OKL42555.1 hypothetical protein A3843_18005 [Pseudovibrio exalbescens]
MLYVSPLSKLEDVARSDQFGGLISLTSPSTEFARPDDLQAVPHLSLRFHDIPEPREGYVAPAPEHVSEILSFAQSIHKTRPILIHCWAGISRSTAAAFIIACSRSGAGCEAELANALRTAAPSATPNPLLVKYADALLERDGRMIDAIARIGRGADAFEGTPFRFPFILPPS